MKTLVERTNWVLKVLVEELTIEDKANDLLKANRREELEELVDFVEERGREIANELVLIVEEVKELEEIEEDLKEVLVRLGNLIIDGYNRDEGKEYNPDDIGNKEDIIKENDIPEDEIKYLETTMFIMEFAYNNK